MRIRVLHTSGHAPEHIAMVGTDKTRGPEPWFLLGGHPLMVGDLGRAKLASSAEEGARSLFSSVQKLKRLHRIDLRAALRPQPVYLGSVWRLPDCCPHCFLRKRRNTHLEEVLYRF